MDYRSNVLQTPFEAKSCVLPRVLESLQRSFNCKRLLCFRCAKQGVMHGPSGSVGRSQRGWAPLLYLFTVVRRTCAHTRQSGRIVKSRWLPAKSNPLTCTYMQKHSFSRDRRRERATEKKRKGGRQTRPRLRRPAKWINDRRGERVRNASKRLDVCISRAASRASFFFFTLTRNCTTPRRLEFCWFFGSAEGIGCTSAGDL